MTPTLATLERWLAAPGESEQLEFKEARQQFSPEKLLRHCAALANEGGGCLVLGISDKRPRQVVGTGAFPAGSALNDVKALVVDKLRLRVDVTELEHPDGRVLVFDVPSRPMGRAVSCDGVFLMRAGEGTVAMTQDMLKAIHAEDAQDWFGRPACEGASPDDVIALLDTQAYFDLVEATRPDTRVTYRSGRESA